ncbi:MAG TPA: HD domain-containing phosphohydrolase, partial [Deinococcales bacterium]|nr:HD domain-containing phosphohydrolase [Deinococcales bacterium]
LAWLAAALRLSGSSAGDAEAPRVMETLELLAQDTPDATAFQAILQAAIVEIPGVQAACLLTLDGSDFVVRASTGAAPVPGARLPGAAVRAVHGADGTAWAEGAPRLRLGREAAEVSLFPSHATGAVFVQPLVVEDRTTACLLLSAPLDSRVFDEAGRQSAVGLGRQIAAILAADARRDRYGARMRELEILVQVTQALHEARGREEVERTVAAQVVDILHTPNVCLLRLGEGRSLRGVLGLGWYAGSVDVVVPEGAGLSWCALNAGQVQLSQDCSLDGRVFQGNRNPHKTILAAPMFASTGEPLGVLLAGRDALVPFSELDAAMTQAIATAGAAAVERVERSAAFSRKAAENELLLELTRLATQARTVRDAARVVLERLAERFELARATYLELNGDYYVPQVYVRNGLAGNWRGHPLAAASRLVSRLRSEAGGVLLNADPLEGLSVAESIQGDENCLVSALAIGHPHDGPLEALILLYSHGRREWSGAEADLLFAIGHTLGGLLARLRQEATLRTSLERFRELAEATARLEDLDDPERIAREGVRAGLRLLGMDFGVFYNGLTMDRLTAGNVPPDFQSALDEVMAAPRGIVGEVIRTGEVCFTLDYAREPYAVDRMAATGLAASIAAPVMVNEELAGVLALHAMTPLEALPDAAFAVIGALAGRLGRALERVNDIEDIKATREGALQALGAALELRDFETLGHTERVAAMAVQLAEILGLPNTSLDAIRQGAYLHDIGKLGIPDQILLKPGPLTPEEWDVMRSHTIIGDDMAAKIPALPAAARSVIRSHHERIDGKGYPDALAGEAIPLEARVFSVVDVFDALTSARPYKPAWSEADALNELLSGAGRAFDARVVQAFVELRRNTSGSAADRLRRRQRQRELAADLTVSLTGDPTATLDGRVEA